MQESQGDPGQEDRGKAVGAGPACRRDAGLTPAKGEEDARVSESTAASEKFHPGHQDFQEPKSPLESALRCRKGPGSGPPVLGRCLGVAHGVTIVSEITSPIGGSPHPDCQHVNLGGTPTVTKHLPDAVIRKNQPDSVTSVPFTSTLCSVAGR